MKTPARRFPWPLASLPLVEAACFAGACALLDAHPLAALALLGLAAVALSFAVHVFFHECIHASWSTSLPRAFTWPASVLMGLPFDGYRIHHLNHHRHDNGPADFSSTWRWTAQGRRPWSRVLYALSWPRQTVAAGMSLRRRGPEHGWSREIAARMPAQRSAILLALTALMFLSWPLGLLYVALVYLGWSAVALQNYGQHPPVSVTDRAVSCAHPLYNRLLFNNGLHWEHHARPDLPWNELVARERSPRIALPHLLQPLVSRPRMEVPHDG